MSDLISRADAIEAIQNAYCKPCKERGDDHNEVMCRACEFDDAMIQIDIVPSAEAEWIPCSERLPLVGGEFLVTLVDKDGAWVSTAQWNMTFGGRWQDIFPNDGYRDISNVIAWKTLPTPYKGGDTE